MNPTHRPPHFLSLKMGRAYLITVFEVDAVDDGGWGDAFTVFVWARISGVVSEKDMRVA